MSHELPASAELLTPNEAELVEVARQAIDAAADRHGVHTVRAAVRASDGRTFVGVNLHHFTGGPCAETVALATARTAGAGPLTHIVAVGNGGRGVLAPCGRDRQILLDYYADIRVIVPAVGGLLSVSVGDLLPFATTWSIGGGSTSV